MNKYSSPVIISPYYDNSSASSRFILQFIQYFSSHKVDVIWYLPDHSLKSVIPNIAVQPKRISCSYLLGLRFSSLLLAYYYYFFTHKVIISDLNPFFLTNSARVFHIVHHIDDFPSSPAFFKRLIPTNFIYRISRFFWRCNLSTSPRCVITVSHFCIINY